MKRIHSFVSSGNCRAVVLLVFLLGVHAYMKIKEYTMEMKILRSAERVY